MNYKKIISILLLSLSLIIINGCKSNLVSNIIDCKIKSGEDITIFIAADPHHLSKNTYSEGKAFDWFINSGDGKLLTYTDDIIGALTLDIKSQKPDVLIIPGDLTCNGERDSHLEMVEKLKAIEKLGTDVYVIPGNHDIDNPWARNYVGDKMLEIETIDKEEFLKLYKHFGYDEAILLDNDSLSYLAAPSEDLWILMLDTSKYERNKMLTAPEMGGVISSKTLKWIEECSSLAKENNAEIVAVMHHSLMDHSEVINENYTVDNNQEVIDTLIKCNIQIILSGHIHIQDIKYFKNDDNTIYDIATSCLASYPNQYGILEFSPNKGYNYSTRNIYMDRWVNENNIDDENLRNFREYSRDFSWTCSYNKYYDSLLEISQFSDEEMRAISSTIASLNLRYFGGYRNQAMYDIIESEGFQILMNTAPCFVKSYAMSMYDDLFTNNNKIFIPIKR